MGESDGGEGGSGGQGEQEEKWMMRLSVVAAKGEWDTTLMSAGNGAELIGCGPQCILVPSRVLTKEDTPPPYREWEEGNMVSI